MEISAQRREAARVVGVERVIAVLCKYVHNMYEWGGGEVGCWW